MKEVFSQVSTGPNNSRFHVEGSDVKVLTRSCDQAHLQ